MNLLWTSFLRHAAMRSTIGSIRPLDGVEAAWVHSALPINNGTYLTSPVSSESQLRTRIASACEDAGSHKLPWALYVFEPYLSSISAERAAAVAAEFGLARVMGIEVMTGDVRKLKPPVRPLPDVEFRRITKRDEAWIALDLNLRSYGMPIFMADSVLDTNAYFSDSLREFGYVALHDGKPVSTATVIELDGWLYVALVATDPDHRKRGYAEAVMRHALGAAVSALQVSRTALDASMMGAPLYLAMGYQGSGETWGMYAAV
jgi:GNAT superfamily N-acetyltransferase